MRRLHGEAFILDVVNLHDRDRIITFLTSRWGLKKGVGRGARTKYSRFAGQLQPLAKVAVQWFEKDGRELVRVESVELIEPCRKLFDDLDGILRASYLAEHLVCFAQEDEDASDLMRLLESSLEWLRQGVDPELVLRYYETWILRLAGVFPPPRECPGCDADLSTSFASLTSAGQEIRCERCAVGVSGELRVSPRAVQFLVESARQRPPELATSHGEPQLLRELEEVTARVRRSFLQHELRSYEVMKATLRRERELAGA